MSGYLLRRLLGIIPMMLAVSMVVFFILRFLPGNVVDSLMEQNPGITSDNRGELEREYGLDKPLPVQYLLWLKGMIVGDFGESFVSHESVRQEIQKRSAVTIQLTVFALVLSSFIGILLGVAAALYADTIVDHIARSIAVLGISVPAFWWATVLLVYPSIWWGISPPIKEISFVDDPIGNLKQFWLPSLILGSVSAATIARLTRSSLLEVLRSDYIRTARAKGLRERVVIGRHALRNALGTVVTVISILAATLISGTVVIESIFSLRGLGLLVYDAIGKRDYPVIQSTTFVLSAAVMLINLMADVAYSAMDPRVRSHG